MKPSIVNWGYLGLGYVLLNNVSAIGSSVQTLFERNSVFIEYPILQIIIIFLSVAALGGLVKETPWARVISVIAIGLDTLLAFSMSMFVMIVSKGNYTNSLIWSLVVGIPLLFLAYKIYTSEPLKIYLSKPPHAAP